jgi:hypothetical protein
VCCVLTVLLLAGPRAAIVIWWLVDQARFSNTFDNLILPLLGLIFLPWTTLTYVLVARAGVSGLDWIWLGLAFLIDLGSVGGGAYGNRDRLRGRRA